MSSGKWWSFCLGLNVLSILYVLHDGHGTGKIFHITGHYPHNELVISFDDILSSLMIAWTSFWTNSPIAGDLRRH